jgi:hypothetical protein
MPGTQPPDRPTRYCRRCWYALDGASGSRCPECGRPFDFADQRSYRTMSRGRWWTIRVLRPVVVVLVAVLMIAAIGAVMAYSRHASDRSIMVMLRHTRFSYRSSPLAPTWVADWAGRYRLSMPSTVVQVFFETNAARDDDLVHVSKLANLRHLYLDGEKITDAGLAHLGDMSNLRLLWLGGTRVTEEGVEDLKQALPQLTVYGP